ncbi:hypothetical protein EQH57_0022 [Dictyocoela roeselum]|nr:hypothetical protein EQH57_0022 [Dictyocoela roeselum]
MFLFPLIACKLPKKFTEENEDMDLSDNRLFHDMDKFKVNEILKNEIKDGDKKKEAMVERITNGKKKNTNEDTKDGSNKDEKHKENDKNSEKVDKKSSNDGKKDAKKTKPDDDKDVFSQYSERNILMNPSFEPPVSSLMSNNSENKLKMILEKIKEGHKELEAMNKKALALTKDYEKIIEMLSKKPNVPEDRLDFKIIEVQEKETPNK